jgi:phage terminase small subunit
MPAHPITLPKDPRHQRFADLILAGTHNASAAYIAAGFKVGITTARVNSGRLLKRPDVIAYMTAIRQAAADESVLTISEILKFCARVVRTGIGDLDPSAESPTGDLIKSHSSNEGEMGSSYKVEKHCPFKAIDTHLKLTGNNPEADAIKELAAAIGSLGGSVLPTGKL